ncbi:hypothetical protein FNV43_RR19295 [Rhamnella rubrinervis]|uniref:Uncharacterized protein n=1 Tax=Rhamnella rubrinervis TaxID=2594499 RepID=A0A8K0GWD3_9ROSA|nr:hypothetical protein FNV43_RR19295 [Rhamnella rubrinervis]
MWRISKFFGVLGTYGEPVRELSGQEVVGGRRKLAENCVGRYARRGDSLKVMSRTLLEGLRKMAEEASRGTEGHVLGRCWRTREGVGGLWEVGGGHRKMTDGHRKLLEGHRKLLECRSKMLEGRKKLSEGIWKLAEGRRKMA